MEQGLVSYTIALGALGTASGLEIVAKRAYDPFIYAPQKLAASSAGIADIVLMIAAFFLFPVWSAIMVIMVGGARSKSKCNRT